MPFSETKIAVMDVQCPLMSYDELEMSLRCSGVVGRVFIVPKLVPDSRFASHQLLRRWMRRQQQSVPGGEND